MGDVTMGKNIRMFTKMRKNQSYTITTEQMQKEIEAAERWLKHRDPWDEIKIEPPRKLK